MKKITGGLYFLYDNDDLVYIGKSANIFYRIGTHIQEGVKDFNNWEYQIVEDEIERSNLEGYLIEIFKPKYNQKGEQNDIFNKDKILNTKYDWELDTAIESYKTINKYDFIPMQMLDDIFGIDNISWRLYHNNYIPEDVVNEETLYGYTKHGIINKTWVLQNINYLTKCIDKLLKECK